MQNYKRSDKHPYFIQNDCTNVYVIKADVAFKSIKIKFVTTYTCTHHDFVL